MEEKIIHALATSLHYRLEDDSLLKVLNLTLARVLDKTDRYLLDEDINFITDIFYGTLVCAFGDYGIAPRGGWIEGKHFEMVIRALREEIEQTKLRKEIEDGLNNSL